MAMRLVLVAILVVTICMFLFLSLHINSYSILWSNTVTLKHQPDQILNTNCNSNMPNAWEACKNIQNPTDKRFGAQPDTYDEVFNFTRTEANVAYRKRCAEPLIILAYAKGVNKNNPPDYPWGALEGQGRTDECSSNCIYTLDSRMISCADLVVVHHKWGGLDVGNLKWLREQNKQVPWAWMEHESPHNTRGQSKLDNLFQFTATFSKSSHLWVSNFFVVPKEKPDTSGTAVDHTKGKTNFVITFMSNCVGFRIDIIRKLQKYIKVDFFGGCNKNSGSCPRGSDACEKKQKTYKFYLALENSFCEDYHTEKFYWQGLQKGLIPITFFDPDSLKSKPIVAPPKSFINILDYPNMKALADHLNYLNKNDTAYNEYNAWRNDFVVYEKNRCAICDAAHRINVKEKRGLPTIKIQDHWSKSKRCTGYENKMFQKYLI